MARLGFSAMGILRFHAVALGFMILGLPGRQLEAMEIPGRELMTRVSAVLVYRTRTRDQRYNGLHRPHRFPDKTDGLLKPAPLAVFWRLLLIRQLHLEALN